MRRAGEGSGGATAVGCLNGSKRQGMPTAAAGKARSLYPLSVETPCLLGVFLPLYCFLT